MKTTSTTTNAGPAEENPGLSLAVKTEPSTTGPATTSGVVMPANVPVTELLQGNSTPSLTTPIQEKMLGEDECDYEIIVDVKEEDERMIRRDLARKHKPTCRIREKQPISCAKTEKDDDDKDGAQDAKRKKSSSIQEENGESSKKQNEKQNCRLHKKTNVKQMIEQYEIKEKRAAEEMRKNTAAPSTSDLTAIIAAKKR